RERDRDHLDPAERPGRHGGHPTGRHRLRSARRRGHVPTLLRDSPSIRTAAHVKMTPAEMAAAVERANRRLDGKGGFRLRCPRCGHEDGVPDDPEKSLYTCDECGCPIAFGEEQPEIAITPHADRRFVVTRFVSGPEKKRNDISITLDREYAAQLA